MQLINIGLIVITRSTTFTNDIRAWNETLPATKTWPEFKTHFRTAQKPSTTTDALGYHLKANAAKEGDDAVSRISLPSKDGLTVPKTAAAEGPSNSSQLISSTYTPPRLKTKP